MTNLHFLGMKMLFSSPTFQSEIHKIDNDKQQITLHINNAVSCNEQSSVEVHKATKLFHHQPAPNHHLPHCTDELLARDHVKIPCIFVTVPYHGMCIIVSVCCAWPMTLFSASLIRPLEGVCIQMDIDSCSARMAYTSLEWHGDLAHMHHHVHLGIITDTLMKERQKTGHMPRLDNRI